MSTNNHTIKYIAGYKTEDGVLMPIWNSISFNKTFTKRYSNHSHKLVGLSPSAVILWNRLCENVSPEDNTVFNTKYDRGKFIEFCKSNCGISYSDETVKKAFYKLSKNHLLIKYKSKSVFTVNPKYYFAGTEEQRRKILKELCNFAVKQKGKTGIDMRRSLGFKNPAQEFFIPNVSKKSKQSK